MYLFIHNVSITIFEGFQSLWHTQNRACRHKPVIMLTKQRNIFILIINKIRTMLAIWKFLIIYFKQLYKKQCDITPAFLNPNDILSLCAHIEIFHLFSI